LKPDEENIANAAAGMIRLYGENAITYANLLSAKFAKRKDQEGEENWRAIAQAIEKQQSQPRPISDQQKEGFDSGLSGRFRAVASDA
jgi:hypothetical protein